MKKIITTICILLIVGFLLNLQAAFAELSPKEILAKSDRARGNIQGIQWRIKINSIELAMPGDIGGGFAIQVAPHQVPEVPLFVGGQLFIEVEIKRHAV